MLNPFFSETLHPRANTKKIINMKKNLNHLRHKFLLSKKTPFSREKKTQKNNKLLASIKFVIQIITLKK